LFLTPKPATGSVGQVDFPRWDLPARMAAATVFVVALGLFAFASFFLVLALALTLPDGIALAFAFAIAVALVVQGASLAVGRRFGLA
jgi:hypothetical protein